MANNITILLPEFFQALRTMSDIDDIDWVVASRLAEHWKMSIADVLLELHAVDESILAKALARAHGLQYIAGHSLTCDFSDVDTELFSDLLNVGAAPLQNNRLAVCNPYDDHRGHLGSKMCEREMVVTERSLLYEALRKQSLTNWF
ncbi:MAG: hypothetical protein FJY29_07890 [Betaproteobacteria bacterium]|nr:hypothetical protein [Betaproteobacteria bacterium]